MTSPSYDAVVIGAGPNGLAAAITLARAGPSVVVFEQSTRVGGGVRSDALTLPGFIHDEYSSVYPLGVASPFFGSLPLQSLGVEWVHPPLAVAHPLERGYRTSAAGLYLCSSSTPSGGGVHGMCGYHAVRVVLEKGTGVFFRNA